MHLIILHFGTTITEIASAMGDFITPITVLMVGDMQAIGEVSILSIVPLIMVDFTILIDIIEDITIPMNIMEGSDFTEGMAIME